MLKKVLKALCKGTLATIMYFTAAIGLGGWAMFIADPNDFSIYYWDEEWLTYVLLGICMFNTLKVVSRIITKEVKTNKE